MKSAKTRTQRKMEQNRERMRDLLGEKYSNIDLIKFQATEGENETEIKVKIDLDGETKSFEASGAGPVDALWQSMVSSFDNSTLLTDLTLKGYKAQAVGLESEHIRPDSEVCVTVILSSDKSEINFESTSTSVLKASVLCFLEVVEYLINSERAFEEASDLLESARDRNRQDLIVQYRSLLSELTRVVPH